MNIPPYKTKSLAPMALLYRLFVFGNVANKYNQVLKKDGYLVTYLPIGFPVNETNVNLYAYFNDRKIAVGYGETIESAYSEFVNKEIEYPLDKADWGW